MSYKQYIGARYVPLVDGEWSSEKIYEPLTIITYMNSSYTSKKTVPAGILPTNTEYWALTGNYNAQFETLRQEVAALESDLTGYKSAIDGKFSDLEIINVKDYGARGDGTTDDSDAILSAIEYANSLNAFGRRGAIYFPRGTYFISKQLWLRYSVTLFAHNNASIYSRLATSDAAVYIYQHQRVTIEGLEFINDNNGNGWTIDCYGIGCTIRNCHFTLQNGNGVRIHNHDNVIYGCRIIQDGYKATAVCVDSLSGDDGVNWTINNRIINNAIYAYNGVDIRKSFSGHLPEGTIINANTILGDNEENSVGVVIRGAFATFITDNIIDQSQYGVYLQVMEDGITQVKIDSNYIGSSVSCVWSPGTQIAGLSITANTLWCTENTGGNLIRLGGSTRIIIANNSFTISGGYCIGLFLSKNILIQGNVFQTANASHYWGNLNLTDSGVAVLKDNFIPDGFTANGIYDSTTLIESDNYTLKT